MTEVLTIDQLCVTYLILTALSFLPHRSVWESVCGDTEQRCRESASSYQNHQENDRREGSESISEGNDNHVAIDASQHCSALWISAKRYVMCANVDHV